MRAGVECGRNDVLRNEMKTGVGRGRLLDSGKVQRDLEQDTELSHGGEPAARARKGQRRATAEKRPPCKQENTHLVRETARGVREKRIRGARRGSLATNFSIKTKRTRTIAPPQIVPQTMGALQGCWLPRVALKVSGGIQSRPTCKQDWLTSQGKTDKEKGNG